MLDHQVIVSFMNIDNLDMCFICSVLLDEHEDCSAKGKILLVMDVDGIN